MKSQLNKAIATKTIYPDWVLRQRHENTIKTEVFITNALNGHIETIGEPTTVLQELRAYRLQLLWIIETARKSNIMHHNPSKWKEFIKFFNALARRKITRNDLPTFEKYINHFKLN